MTSKCVSATRSEWCNASDTVNKENAPVTSSSHSCTSNTESYGSPAFHCNSYIYIYIYFITTYIHYIKCGVPGWCCSTVGSRETIWRSFWIHWFIGGRADRWIDWRPRRTAVEQSETNKELETQKDQHQVGNAHLVVLGCESEPPRLRHSSSSSLLGDVQRLRICTCTWFLSLYLHQNRFFWPSASSSRDSLCHRDVLAHRSTSGVGLWAKWVFFCFFCE